MDRGEGTVPSPSYRRGACTRAVSTEVCSLLGVLMPGRIKQTASGGGGGGLFRSMEKEVSFWVLSETLRGSPAAASRKIL